MKHGRAWEGAALESNAVVCASVPLLSFFFSRIRADSARFELNRADSAEIKPYRPNWPATETAEMAETGKNMP